MDGKNTNIDFGQIVALISNLLPQVLSLLDLKNIILNGTFKYKAHDGNNLQIDNFGQFFDNLSRGIDYSRIQNLTKENQKADKELESPNNKKKLTDEEAKEKDILKTLIKNNNKIIERYKNTQQPSQHIQTFLSGFLDYESRNFKFLITIIHKIITTRDLDENNKTKKNDREGNDEHDKINISNEESKSARNTRLLNELAHHIISDADLNENEKNTINAITSLLNNLNNKKDEKKQKKQNLISNIGQNTQLITAIPQIICIPLFANIHSAKDFALNFAKNNDLHFDDILSIGKKNNNKKNNAPGFIKNTKFSSDSKLFKVILLLLKIISFKKDILGNQEERDNFLKNIEKLQMLLYFQLHLISTINSQNTEKDRERFKKDIAQLISSFQDQYNKIAVSFISKIYFLKKDNAFVKFGLWIAKSKIERDPIELILENAINLPNGHIIAVNSELTIEIATLKKKISKKVTLKWIKTELNNVLNKIEQKHKEQITIENSKGDITSISSSSADDESISEQNNESNDDKARQKLDALEVHIKSLKEKINRFNNNTGDTKSTIDALALHLNLNPQDYNKNNTVCSVANDNLKKLNEQIIQMNGLENEKLLIENDGGIIFPNHQKQNTAGTVIFQPQAQSNQSHSSQNIQQQQKNNTIFYGATGAAVGISAVGIPVTLTGNINTEKKILISLAIILLAVIAIVVSKVVSDKINYKDSQEVNDRSKSTAK